MSKNLLEAGEYAPFRSGLFRPLRSPAYGGILVCSRVSSSTCRRRGSRAGEKKEGVFAWMKGIGSKVSGSVLRDSWSLEERAGKELMQEKDSGAKLNSTGRGLHLRKERPGREPRQEKEMTEKELLFCF